jgi:DNA-directed RNA polymerase specialized sigma24 family protein
MAKPTSPLRLPTSEFDPKATCPRNGTLVRSTLRSRVPEHYRQIVLLRDVDELTIDEIAQSLSLSREAVKGRLHLARGLIREYLTG